MSHVTNVILLTEIEESMGNFKPILDMIALLQVDAFAGGGNAMECDVYAGAFNCLEIDKLLEAFHSCTWENPESVQLLIRDQHDERFAVYVPKGEE